MTHVIENQSGDMTRGGGGFDRHDRLIETKHVLLRSRVLGQQALSKYKYLCLTLHSTSKHLEQDDDRSQSTSQTTFLSSSTTRSTSIGTRSTRWKDLHQCRHRFDLVRFSRCSTNFSHSISSVARKKPQRRRRRRRNPPN